MTVGRIRCAEPVGIILRQWPAGSIRFIDPVVDTGNVPAFGHSEGNLIGEGLLIQLGFGLVRLAAVNRLGDIKFCRLVVGAGNRAATGAGNIVGFIINRIGSRTIRFRVVLIHQHQVRQRAVNHHRADSLSRELLRVAFILRIRRWNLFQLILMAGFLDVQGVIGIQCSKTGSNLDGSRPFLFFSFKDIGIGLAWRKRAVLLVVIIANLQVKVHFFRPVSGVNGVVPFLFNIHLIGFQRH